MSTIRRDVSYSYVPVTELHPHERHSGYNLESTAVYVAKSLNEGRSGQQDYIWTEHIEKRSRFAVVIR